MHNARCKAQNVTLEESFPQFAILQIIQTRYALRLIGWRSLHHRGKLRSSATTALFAQQIIEKVGNRISVREWRGTIRDSNIQEMDTLKGSEKQEKRAHKTSDVPFRLMSLPVELRTMVFKILLVMPGSIIFMRTIRTLPVVLKTEDDIYAISDEDFSKAKIIWASGPFQHFSGFEDHLQGDHASLLWVQSFPLRRAG